MLVIIICMVFIDFYPYGFGAWKNQSDSILIVVALIIKNYGTAPADGMEPGLEYCH